MESGRQSDFQIGWGGGGVQHKRHFLERGKSQSENIQSFLDIGIYPYIVITLSGMLFSSKK